ncbi:hypothetical protein ACHAXT_006850 [Thalassiosira profunda]
MQTSYRALRRISSSHGALPGGFNADGLREWAMLHDFGALGESAAGRDMRQRRRQIDELEPKELPYVDLFSRRLSDECAGYLSNHPSPSDVLGRAFFGSNSFLAERALLSLYPKEAKSLPTKFNVNDQYLQWKVAMKSPLELILSYNVERLQFRGCTMLAFDPSLRKAFHGNCIDVTEVRMQGPIARFGVQMHVKYAEYLLEGMCAELEKVADPESA